MGEPVRDNLMLVCMHVQTDGIYLHCVQHEHDVSLSMCFKRHAVAWSHFSIAFHFVIIPKYLKIVVKRQNMLSLKGRSTQ